MPHALIETVRVIDGRAPLWNLHLGRLTQSALALRLPIPDLEPPAGGTDRVVRFQISRGGVQVSERDVGSIAPLALATSPARHRGYPHKVADRAWLDAARTSASILGADDALLADGEQRVIEATLWAVGWWEKEALCFPPLALGGLPSVARARLADMVRGGIHEAAVSPHDLGRRAVLACNAARGIVPVAVLDGRPLRANHRTAALAKRFWPLPAA